MVGKGEKEEKKNNVSVIRVIHFISIIDLNLILLVYITSNFCTWRQLLFPLMCLFYSSAHILPLPQACLPSNIDYESVYFWQLFWVQLLESHEILPFPRHFRHQKRANNIKLNVFNKLVYSVKKTNWFILLLRQTQRYFCSMLFTTR